MSLKMDIQDYMRHIENDPSERAAGKTEKKAKRTH
jgi:hypothetical protein